MIRIEHVIKTYTKDNNIVKALDNLSISVTKGEFVVVKGASGCGKTTLLLTTGGLLYPQKGEVIINGQKIYDLTPENRAKFRADNIGFVFQQYHLIPYMTVLENIEIPTLAHDTKLPVNQAIELIEELGLKNRMHHTPSELSAGEKQRTALARALLYNPKIILADEITGNLDAENAGLVLKKLKDYVISGGTVLLVTHDEKVFSYADRIIEMQIN